MFMFIKYAEDKETLAHIKELSGCDKVDEDTFDTLVNYINEPRLLEWKKEIKNEEGVVNMCKGIDDLIEDGKREGKIVSELWTIRNPGDVRFPGVFVGHFGESGLISIRTIRCINGDHQHHSHQLVRRIGEVDDVGVTPVEELLGDVDDGAAAVVDVVVPAEKIAFHAPTVAINFVFGLQKGKLLLDTAHGLAIELDVKGGKHGEELLFDETDFVVIGVIDVEPVAQG